MTGPDAPLDEVDTAILADVRTLYDRADPPPSDLVARVTFAIDLEQVDLELVDLEVARLAGDELVGSGARAEQVEAARTVTFDAASLTIMVTITETGDGLVRVDGWLAPPGTHRVELRFAGTAASRSAVTDSTGRFVLDRVARGLAQFMVHVGDTHIATPSLVL